MVDHNEEHARDAETWELYRKEISGKKQKNATISQTKTNKFPTFPSARRSIPQ